MQDKELEQIHDQIEIAEERYKEAAFVTAKLDREATKAQKALDCKTQQFDRYANEYNQLTQQFERLKNDLQLLGQSNPNQDLNTQEAPRIDATSPTVDLKADCSHDLQTTIQKQDHELELLYTKHLHYAVVRPSLRRTQKNYINVQQRGTIYVPHTPIKSKL